MERYKKHLKSLEEAEKNKKYTVQFEVSKSGGKIYFHLQKDFESKKEAKEFMKTIQGKSLKIIDLERKEVRVKRPLPLNTVRLASLASRVLKISSREALRIAEKLYLEGYITYPRTETDRYNKFEIANLENIFNALKKNGLIPKNISYNKPLNGNRSDRAHPPIRPERVVPLKKVRKTLKFDRDLATKMYELIVKHFAANLMEDALLEEITIKAQVIDHIAIAKIRKVLEPGFLKIYKMDENLFPEQATSQIPKQNETLKIEKAEILEKLPPITQPISESELVRLMDKLGIGTDATFAEHINKILNRKYVERKGGRLIPTPLGIALYDALKHSAPEIVDPKIRAEMETWFTQVEKGELKPEEAVDRAIEKFASMYDTFYGKISEFTNSIVKAVRSMGIDRFIKTERRGREKPRREKSSKRQKKLKRLPKRRKRRR